MQDRQADPDRLGVVTVRLSPEMRAAVEALAERRARDLPGYSRSDVIRVALIEHLRRADSEGRP